MAPELVQALIDRGYVYLNLKEIHGGTAGFFFRD